MKRKGVSICACLMVLACCASVASAIVFSTDATIDNGAQLAQVIIIGQGTTVTMTGGVVEKMEVRNSAVINVVDGQITNYLGLRDSGTANLFGGWIKELLALDSSVIYLHAEGVNHDPVGGKWNTGRITGNWIAGGPFAIDLYDSDFYGNDTYAHITILPEPATLALFGIGALFLRSRHR